VECGGHPCIIGIWPRRALEGFELVEGGAHKRLMEPKVIKGDVALILEDCDYSDKQTHFVRSAV